MKDKILLLLNKTINNTNKSYALMKNIIKTETINNPIEININTNFVKESFHFFYNNANKDNKFFYSEIDGFKNNICFISELHININLLNELENININLEKDNKESIDNINKIIKYFKNETNMNKNYYKKNIRIDSIVFIENSLGLCEFKIKRNNSCNSATIFTDVIRSLYIMNKNIKIEFSLIVCINGNYLNNNYVNEQEFFLNNDIDTFEIDVFLDKGGNQLSCEKIYDILEEKIINQKNFIILINNKKTTNNTENTKYINDNINLSKSLFYDDICNKIKELTMDLNLDKTLTDLRGETNNNYYIFANYFINYHKFKSQYHSILGSKVLHSKILDEKRINNLNYFINFLNDDFIKLNKDIFTSEEWKIKNNDLLFENEEIKLNDLLENPQKFIGHDILNEDAKDILEFKLIINNLNEDNKNNSFFKLYKLVDKFTLHINNFFKKNLLENKKNKSPETLYSTNVYNKRSKSINLFIQLVFSNNGEDIKESILFINNYYNKILDYTKIYKSIFLSLKMMCVSCIYFLSYKNFEINNIKITINELIQKNFQINENDNIFLYSCTIENEILNILLKENYNDRKKENPLYKEEIIAMFSDKFLKIILQKNV